jgi:hypothetical protein
VNLCEIIRQLGDYFDSSLHPELVFEHRNCPDGRSCSASYFERQAYEPKSPTPDELMQVDQVLVVGKTQLPADMVDLFVGYMPHAR